MSLMMGGLAIFLAVALTGGFLVAYAKYKSLWDGINRIDVHGDLTGKLPPVDPNALNILIIGSDTRSGINGLIGGKANISGARSDSDLILHIAPGAHQVAVLSIPRDSVVPILNCTPEAGTAGQTAQPAGTVEQINATFANGGPGCLWKTIEATTGIHVDDFLELTFIGFQKAIDALGGVSVCLPYAVNDPISKLHLTAGKHHVFGREALAFWRTREGLGMGSDPQRIQRDQFLMASLVQGVERSGLLSSPSRMLRVVDVLTRNHYITTDSELSPSKLLRIAEDLRGIKPRSVQFVGIPWTGYVNNPNWVQWIQPQATDLFSAIAHDTKLPRAVQAGKKGKKAPTVKPSQVRVAVFNGTNTSGLAGSTATSLSARGFRVIGQASNAPTTTYTDSVIEYAAASDLPAAQTLAAQLGGSVKLQLDPQLGSPTLHLIIGSAFSALTSVSSAKAKASSIANLASTYGGITGNANICRDQAAFAGPNGG